MHKANHLVLLSQVLGKKRYIVYKESAYCFSRCSYCFWVWYLLSIYYFSSIPSHSFIFLFYFHVELWSEEQMELHFAKSSVDSCINLRKCRHWLLGDEHFSWVVLGFICFKWSECNGHQEIGAHEHAYSIPSVLLFMQGP